MDFIRGDGIRPDSEDGLDLNLWKSMLFIPRTTFPQQLSNVDLSKFDSLPEVGRDLLLTIYRDVESVRDKAVLEDLVMSIIYAMDDDSTIRAVGLRYGIDVALVEGQSAAEVLLETLESIIYSTRGVGLREVIDREYDGYSNYDDYLNRLVIYAMKYTM